MLTRLLLILQCARYKPRKISKKIQYVSIQKISSTFNLFNWYEFNCNQFQMLKEPVSWSGSFFVHYLFGVGRYALWHILTDSILHYFYFASIHRHLMLMKTVPILTLCKFGLIFNLISSDQVFKYIYVDFKNRFCADNFSEVMQISDTLNLF